MAKPVPLGTKAQIERTVEFKHTLTYHHPELPQVLTTPDMIGWMEFACFMAALPFCEGDEVTVGTHINVAHRAPTGVGSKVTAEAELERIEGRFHIFKCTARDEHQLLGDGYIHRAFVSKGKFTQKKGVSKE